VAVSSDFCRAILSHEKKSLVCDKNCAIFSRERIAQHQTLMFDNKKRSYPQRKCASNVDCTVQMAFQYETVYARHHERDRQTACVCLVAPSVESVQNAKFDMQQR